MKRQIKFVIIVIVILIVFFILVTFVNGKNISDYFFPKYIINSNGEVWQYKDDNISIVKNDDYLNEKYNIYINGDNVLKGTIRKNGGNFYIKKSGNKNYSKQPYRLISNLNLKLADFTKETTDVWNVNLVRNALSDVSTEFMPYFTGYEISYDLDNDNELETLYFVSNLIADETDMIVTSKVLLKKNGTLYQAIQTSDIYKYDLVNIVDINNDDIYELIIKKQESDGKKLIDCNQLYRLKNNKWKLVYDCNPE